MKFYTQDHEWISVDGEIATIGISEHAQDALGDIVFVDLPAIGAQVSAGAEVAVVESVKAAGEVNAPASGEVLEINEALVDQPSLINSSAEDEGWIFKIKLSNPAEIDSLMDSAAYQAFLE